MTTLERIKIEAENPQNPDNSKPRFEIVVPPSAFTVPRGWEFVLTRPFEGVSYIATVLHNAGYRVKIIDVRSCAEPVNAALKAVKEADVLGIATYEDSFLFLEEFISGVKQKRPGMPVILGGSLVTSEPSVLMENTKADIAVLGEGEESILEVMDAIKDTQFERRLKEITGICYRNEKGDLIFTRKRPQMKDLNSLPVMNFSLWPQVQANPSLKEIFFSHSRGCYMNCSFCYRTTPQLSLKSIDKIRTELRELKRKHNFEFIYFVDLTFVIDKKRALAICEVLKEFNVRWSCMCRVQNMDEEILSKMKEAGCQVILYGFESLDDNILNKAHKGITPSEIKGMVNLTQKAGIQVAGLFILGLPGETKESINKVLEFIKESAGACRVKYLSAIPGTEIYRQALQTGKIKSEVEHLRWLSREKGQLEDEFLNFTELSDAELRLAFKQITSMYIKGPQYEPWA